MNIFFLDYDPVQAAVMQCDAHVSKMPLETAQLLCFVHHNLGSNNIPYKPNPAHQKHPCTLWAQFSLSNYIWLLKHGLALCEENIHRFGENRVKRGGDLRHKSQAVIEWAAEHIPNIPDFGMTTPPRSFGKYTVTLTGDVVQDYRNYYCEVKITEMKTGCKWERGRVRPDWLCPS